jgi:acetyl esterase/lipase
MMKSFGRWGLLLAFAGFTTQALGQAATPLAPVVGPVHAPEGAVSIPLYGLATPGSPTDEIESTLMGRETVVRNVTYPTLTPVLPAPGKANGTAVIVAPGGGFMMLAMQNEGWRVARFLADHGVTAFVLKYRLNPTAENDVQFMQDMSRMFGAVGRGGGKRPELKDPGAGHDASAASKLVRARAAEWHVDPTRVGMIGFSAGAIATLKSVLEASADNDPQTRPPDFFGYIYGPMEQVGVPSDAPPMFAALAMDDPLFGNGDFSIATAWHAAKRPVELHVYQTGGHGFGMGRAGTTTSLMMDQFLAWMDLQGLLKPKVTP